MRFVGFNCFKSKFFWGVILFVSVFLVCVLSVDQIWFKLDDIGTIVDGLIKSWSDFLRVFSTQCRDLIAPPNYKFSKPNFVSALYRPIQNVIFTIIYFLGGLNAYIFYLVNVFFHACNAVLIFYIFSYFMPVNLSFLGGVLFAFYRDVSWLTWICTLQNPLSTFFLLITILIYISFLWGSEKSKQSSWKYYLSGFILLLSFLSRENGIFFVFPAFCGVFLFWADPFDGFWGKLKSSFSKTWIFFVASFLYILIRMWAFGFTTLHRTFNNLFIRFPFLKPFFKVEVKSIPLQSVVQNAVQNTAGTLTTVSKVAKSVYIKNHSFSISDFLLKKLASVFNSLFGWLRNILNMCTNTHFDKVVCFLILSFFILFLFFAYRRHKSIFIFLFLCFLFFAWPGFIAYPNPRYLSSIYPVLIFSFLFGIYLFIKDYSESILKKVVLFTAFFLIGIGSFAGIRKNILGLKADAKNTLLRKAKYEKFFQENSFDDNANFVVVSSPFTSDIHSVFQYFLKNLDLKLYYVLFSTLANRGSMGCRGDYRIKGVESKIVPIKKDGKRGIRLISLNKQHCAWWTNFSYHPIKWSKEEKAYVWTDKRYEVGRWYDFSMGRFIINEMVDGKYVTDITFMFDDGWINENTTFVFWETMEGKYKVLNNNKVIV